ncbi:MAG TPA: DNA gyrase inhibitor YacG [Hyphomicrobiales bacterium]|nr:DNA gyrase inhibitor YacG [Hyphomicrobiales bacterium]
MKAAAARKKPPGAALPPRPCPICGKPSVAAFRPFCSKRCADIDLHRWLGGRYVIPASETDDDAGSSGGDGGGTRE